MSADASGAAQAPQDRQPELPVPAEALAAALGPPPADQPLSRVAGEERPAEPSSVPVLTRDAEAKAKFAEEVHQYIREYIRLADQKATFFFAASTALLAFLYKNGVSSHWLKPVMTWNILDTVAFLGMAALAVCAVMSVFVVIPRTPGSRRGYIFWDAIAEYDTARQYADELDRLTGPTLTQLKAEHCFDLARVCRKKYRVLRIALWFAAIGLGGSVIVFLFL